MKKEKSVIKQDGWIFSKFKAAPGVIVAEVSVKGYDEEWLDDLRDKGSKAGYRVFTEAAETKDYRKRKVKTRIEFYYKFPEDDFENNIPIMHAALEEFIKEKEKK